MVDAPQPAKVENEEDVANVEERDGGHEEGRTVYEPLSTGGDNSDPAPYTARRMPTSATAATATDEFAPDDDDDVPTPPKPTLFQRLGLDQTTLILMFKGSLPPIIGIAMYQSDAVADTFSTIGYLIPIVSILTVPVMPRGKFLQTLFLNALSLSFGAALGMLVCYTGIQARDNTSGPLTPEELAVYSATGRPPYNSSHSAVCGIWLVFSIWLINTIRAKLPSFNLPAIVFSIFIDVVCATSPLMINMTAAQATVKRIYTAMLTAMALSAGVSLFIFPLSSRKILAKQATGAVGLLRKAVKLQRAYLRGLEREDMYALVTVETAVGDLGPAQEREREREKLRRKFKKTGGADAPPPLTKEEKTAQALRETISAMRELAGKMQQEVLFAKRDAAFGKLTAHDLGEIVKLIRNIFIPVTGMSTIMDIFRRTAEHRGWNVASNPNDKEVAIKERERRIWNEVMKQLHEPFTLLSEAIDEGLEHAALQLGLLPKSKEQKAKDKEARKARKAQKARGTQSSNAADAASVTTSDTAANATAASLSSADVSASGTNRATDHTNGGANDKTSAPSSDDIEASAGVLKPGDDGFAKVINEKVKKFNNTHSEVLRVWARERGLLDDAGQPKSPKSGEGLDPVFSSREQEQTQLFVLLYMEQLMIATGEAVEDFIQFADRKVTDGTMDKTRFLFPTLRRMRKWLISVFNDKDAPDEHVEDVVKPNFNVVFMGDSFNTKKDPEHLPATNAWQKFGNGLRVVSRFLGSAESIFGLRVAFATMTVAIIGYLKSTHVFFQEQRLVWAMIIISIGMTQTSGQSIFGFFCRIGGSFIAMVLSLIIWYIVDEKTPGVIVFLWLSIFVNYYFFIKHPRFIAANMLTMITQVLIIAYELQVRKIGVALATSTGQRYYPTYELAPYRLATVAAGSLVAFFWTIFPRPMTDRAWLRRDLSATLYLLANYFSVINETLKTTLYATGGNPDVFGTPAHSLLKVRQKLFTKLMLLLPSLQMHSTWQKWEPTIGGKFPRKSYEDIILRSGRILNYLTLISYTVTWKPRHAPELVDDAWVKALGEMIKSIGPTHYTILSTLALLSNSLLSGQSLPPYIPLPRPYELTRHLLTLKRKKDRIKAAGDAAAAGDATGGSPAKQPPRRRNSVWGKQSWRPERGSNDPNTEGGLYVRQNEDEAVASEFSRPSWHEVSIDAVNTATGAPLERLTSDTAAKLSGVLDASNLEKHGYTEFAVLQVCSTLICDDLEGMIQTISGLVGVVDFSFRMDDQQTDSVDEKGKGKKD